MPDSDIQRLVERIEGDMIREIGFFYASGGVGWRESAAELAVIALALRARFTERTDDDA